MATIDELLIEAQAGSKDSLDKLWIELIPFAERSAKYFCGKYSMRGQAEDLTQELLSKVPVIVDGLTTPKAKAIRDAEAWFMAAFRNHSLNFIRAICKRKSISCCDMHDDRYDRSEGFDYAGLEALDCVVCGNEFIQQHTDQMCCSTKCSHTNLMRRQSVAKLVNDASVVISSLRVGPAVWCDSRELRLLLILKAIGYGISIDGRRLILESEPDNRNLANDIAVCLYSGKPIEMQCQICHTSYAFNPNTSQPKLTCSSSSCKKQFSARASQVQIESSRSYAQDAGFC